MKLEKFEIKSHEFKHPIEIQRKESGVDEDNIPIDGEWQTYFKTRAKILNPGSKEYLEAQKVGIEINKTFFIRARRDKEVTAEDRILYKNEVYEISSPPNNVQDGDLYVEIKAKIVK